MLRKLLVLQFFPLIFDKTGYIKQVKKQPITTFKALATKAKRTNSCPILHLQSTLFSSFEYEANLQ